MKFLREIPTSHLQQKQIDDLSNYGYVLIWKEDSVEVWANAPTVQ